MVRYRCGHCGYEGRCYGIPFVGGTKVGVSAPFCPDCQMNDKLEKL